VLPPPPPVYADVKPPTFYPIIEEPEPLPLPIIEEPQYHHHQHNHPPINYATATYGAGYAYGFDPFLSLGSNNNPRVARKRALLYDRTLFRKDVERKRRSGGTGAKNNKIINTDNNNPSQLQPLPLPTPTTVTLVSSPAGTKRQRRITQPRITPQPNNATQ
jgi:hypothetical protein